MNRYPLWKYLIIVIALIFGVIYTIPNFFGESPAVQISSAKATVKVEPELLDRVERILADSGVPAQSISYDTLGNQGTVRARFVDEDTQFKAKTLLERELNANPADPTYIVAFNLLPNTPQWLQSLGAAPMYLGLDLRGGVHFLMQVDSKAVLDKRVQGLQASARSLLREKNVRHAGIERQGENVVVRFRDAETRDRARTVLTSELSDLTVQEAGEGEDLRLVVGFRPESLRKVVDGAVKQNISTLSKRVNELGVAEPVIQRQGADRIVVQLPGVQDVSRAKDIIGRTATLEVRLVDDTVMRGTETTAAIPLGSELFRVGRGAPVVLYKEPIITGEYISSAAPTFDQNNQPAVGIDLNGDGGRRMREATRSRIGKPMAIVLFEKGQGEVLTVATIQDELGSRFQITGVGSPQEANDLALLLRAGSLAAPMEIIEERTIGPQLGADNISKGFDSTLYGFLIMGAFMIIYYHLFGLFSVVALGVNLMLLVAILSMMQATLTLPGMAAIAFTLGMAIDANVLINERIREELRAGNTPQSAIAMGFDRAWATILDSNITTLIAGLALLLFGSGPVRGFAVVHTLGILTSIFSAVFVSRGFINLWYGRKKRLSTLSIGQVWKPNS
ncbi:MAG TPA: protein translocase subunit SecD [Noviherbaspirillum sp.]